MTTRETTTSAKSREGAVSGSANGVLPFFDEPDNKHRQPIIKEAKAWTTYHCPDDGTNLRYSPGDTETDCTHCGQRLSLVPIKWSGQR